MDALEAIHKRRSIKKLVAPAPSDDELQVVFDAAVTAPDHKELQPWRFFILRGTNKDAFAQVMVDALLQRESSATPGQIDKELSKLGRAPLVVAVAAKHLTDRIPFEELLAATAAATQNMLIAFTALGYGTMWRTGETVEDPTIKRVLGLDDVDAILGFVYVGTAASSPNKRDARDPQVVREWAPGS